MNRMGPTDYPEVPMARRLDSGMMMIKAELACWAALWAHRKSHRVTFGEFTEETNNGRGSLPLSKTA